MCVEMALNLLSPLTTLPHSVHITVVSFPKFVRYSYTARTSSRSKSAKDSKLCMSTLLLSSFHKSLHKRPFGADGYVYASFEKAGVTPGYFMSVNFHGVSERDTRGPLGCVRFWYLLQGDCKMHLKLSQAYLSSPTQLFYDPETMYELWGNETITGQWSHVEVPLYVTRPFKVRYLASHSRCWTFWTITSRGLAGRHVRS